MGKLSSLLKLKPFISKYKLSFCMGITGMLLSSLVSNPIPYIIGCIMDKVLIYNEGYNDFYNYIGIITILYVLRYIISIMSKYVFIKVNNLVVNEMRYSILDKIIDLPMSYLSNTEKGYVQSRMSECSSVGSIFSPAFINLFVNLIDAMFAIIILFSIDLKLSLIVLILIPLFFFFTKTSASEIVKGSKLMFESSAILNGECFEIINGVEDIKILNGKSSHLAKFKNKLDALIKNSMKQSKSMMLLTENINLLNNFGSLLILFVAGFMILKGQLTIGLYTSFSLYVNKVFNATQGVATIGTTIKPVCLNIERIYELLNMKDENNEKNYYLDSEIKSIQLKNATFRYKSNTNNILNSLNLKINKGEKILIKGENGSGKSTLIKLLMGLYNLTDGKILYNDIDSNLINNNSLRNRISIVSQNIFLFKGTVLDNILYGQVNKNREDVEMIIKKLKLEEYINRLPHGLDTQIIQNTVGVSGGQAQIIAFIRAMISNKDVIILDEPISNVDAETREIILNTLNKVNFNGILIVISHLIQNMNFINKIIQIQT